MDILELDQTNESSWDEYLSHSTQAIPFHLAGWKEVMEEVFGQKTYYLLARDGDDIAGVLPLLHIKSILSGNFLTSLPGGLCAENETAALALFSRAKELVGSCKAQYLILRDCRTKWNLPETVTTEDHCTFVAKLSPESDQLWWALKGETRRLIRKALKNKVEVVTGAEFLNEFYPTYSEAMRDKGTPTLGFDFFQTIMMKFPKNFNLHLIRLEQQVLGGGLPVSFKDTVYCTWAGTLHHFYKYNLGYLLHWEALKFGCDNGFRWVDFGRSRNGSGSSKFKMQLGAEPRPLYQQYYLNGTNRAPAVGSALQEDTKYRIFVNVWRRLPLPITERLGPYLRKRMPFG